jgi:hypothetical protein
MDKKGWSQFAARLPHSAASSLKPLKEYVSRRRQTRTGKRVSEKKDGIPQGDGLCLAHVDKLLRDCGRVGASGMDFARRAVAELQSEFKLKDTLFIPKNIKAGLGKEFQLLCHDGAIRPLAMMSTVYDDLRRAVLCFPPFFVFIHVNDNLENVKQLRRMRKKLGQLIGENFDRWIRKVDNWKQKGGGY